MPGYSGTPLGVKLGIKEGVQLHAAGAPAGYLKLISPLPHGAAVSSRISGKTDIVHLFTTKKRELAEKLASYRSKLRPDAVVWVSWPKKAAKVQTDVTEGTIREVALPLGWVDVKVCAVTDVWSGLKLVVRKELR
jgi:hypothetical protein